MYYMQHFFTTKYCDSYMTLRNFFHLSKSWVKCCIEKHLCQRSIAVKRQHNPSDSYKKSSSLGLAYSPEV